MVLRCFGKIERVETNSQNDLFYIVTRTEQQNVCEDVQVVLSRVKSDSRTHGRTLLQSNVLLKSGSAFLKF